MGGTREKTEYASDGLSGHRIGTLPQMQHPRSLPSSSGRTGMGVRKVGGGTYSRSFVPTATAIGRDAPACFVYPPGSSGGGSADACRLSLWLAVGGGGWHDGKPA